jgi:hypothetical protein
MHTQDRAVAPTLGRAQPHRTYDSRTGTRTGTAVPYGGGQRVLVVVNRHNRQQGVAGLDLGVGCGRTRGRGTIEPQPQGGSCSYRSSHLDALRLSQLVTGAFNQHKMRAAMRNKLG